MYPTMYPWGRSWPCAAVQHCTNPAACSPDCLMRGDVKGKDGYRNDEEAAEEKQIAGKDDFVHGFVPNHNHGSVDYTSVEYGHVHQCLDVTYPPTPTEDGGHVHYTDGYVLFEKGHNHHYKACSGPAIPVGSGMHVHHYDFYTSEDNGHRHHVAGVDQPAPGDI